MLKKSDETRQQARKPSGGDPIALLRNVSGWALTRGHAYRKYKPFGPFIGMAQRCRPGRPPNRGPDCHRGSGASGQPWFRPEMYPLPGRRCAPCVRGPGLPARRRTPELYGFPGSSWPCGGPSSASNIGKFLDGMTDNASEQLQTRN
jgi:hypothetical protein